MVGWSRKYIKDEALRVVMSFHPLLVGGNPFTTTSIYTLIAYLERKWGVWFAKGGTGAIVQALVDLFVVARRDARAAARRRRRSSSRAGASAACGWPAGARCRRAIVVSNGDAPATYKRLLPASARKKYTDAKIDRMRYSMSLFVSYFGTKKTYPDLAHHTILLGPRYRELLHDIFDKKLLAPDFSLYLHAPTRTDASLAPPGCENFYVLSPVPHLESGDDWSKRGAEYQEKLFAYLEDNAIPGLRENLVTSRLHHAATTSPTSWRRRRARRSPSSRC